MSNPYSTQRLVEFKSEEKQWTSPKGKMQFEGFVEKKIGEKKHRCVIKGFQVSYILNLTVATAVCKGEDLYRAVRGCTVVQKDNVKRYDDIDGASLRIANYMFMGPQRVKEHQDVPIGTFDVPITVYVPLSKPMLYNPDDTAMGADVFNYIEIKMADPADLSKGASVVTINNGRCWVTAECFEEPDVIQHAVDTVSTSDFEGALETKLIVGGKLQDLAVFSPGAGTNGGGGGEIIGGIATVRILELQRDDLYVCPDLIELYARRRGIVTNNRGTKGTDLYQDPFVSNSTLVDSIVQAIAVTACHGNKIAEDPELGIAHVKITQQNTLSPFTGTLRCVMRVMQKTNPKLAASLGADYKATGLRPKVAKASNSAPSTDAVAYMPKQLTK